MVRTVVVLALLGGVGFVFYAWATGGPGPVVDSRDKGPKDNKDSQSPDGNKRGGPGGNGDKKYHQKKEGATHECLRKEPSPLWRFNISATGGECNSVMLLREARQPAVTRAAIATTEWLPAAWRTD